MAQEKKLTLTLSSDTDIKALETLLTTGEVEILLSSTNPKLNGKPIAVTSIGIENKDPNFYTRKQWPALSTMQAIVTDKKQPWKVDGTGDKVLNNADVKITLAMQTVEVKERATELVNGKAVVLTNKKEVDKVLEVRPTANLLLDLLMIEWETNRGTKVVLPLDKFMNIRGLSDKKDARQQVKDDLQALYGISLEFRELDAPEEKKKGKKKDRDFIKTRILSAYGIRNRMICIEFADLFVETMRRTNTLLSLPALLFMLSANYNSSAQWLLRFFSEQKRMNDGKANDDIFLTKTIVEKNPYIDSYDEVMEKKNRAVKRYIYEPLEKALDNLNEILSWEYRDEKKAVVDRDTAKSLKYNIYAELRIHIHWKAEPLIGWRSKKTRKWG